MNTVKSITKIPATRQQFTSRPLNIMVKRRVSGYARVSTDSDEQKNSYEAQVDYYTKYISERGDWEFITVYTDEGISATSMKKREGFNQMVVDALSGKFDLLITKSVSRFARNTVDSLTTIRLLKEHGVEIFFEEQGIWTFDSNGELLITIMSSMAQEESRSISENTTWGQRKRMADGKISLPYSRFLGYDKGEDDVPVINEAEAEIVRLIYQLFLEGKTPHGIAVTLTKRGILTPGGKTKWGAATVKSILQNEKYTGNALLQKSFTVDYLKKTKKVNEGEVPQFYIENSHPAIISSEIYDMVGQEFKRRKKLGNRHSGAGMFSARIVCGDCGGFFGSKIWHSTDKYRRVVWQCNAKFSNGHKCSTPHLSEEKIKEYFIIAANRLLDEQRFITEDLREVNAELFDTAAFEAERFVYQREMNMVAEIIHTNVADNARRKQDQTEYRERYNALTERFETAQSRYNELSAQISSRQRRRRDAETFLTRLRKKEPMDEFDAQFFVAAVERVVVRSADDICFVFRDGTEIVV